ncbi:hypothetical protein D3C86_1275030 [compost metagenome]
MATSLTWDSVLTAIPQRIEETPSELVCDPAEINELVGEMNSLAEVMKEAEAYFVANWPEATSEQKAHAQKFAYRILDPRRRQPNIFRKIALMFSAARFTFFAIKEANKAPNHYRSAQSLLADLVVARRNLIVAGDHLAQTILDSVECDNLNYQANLTQDIGEIIANHDPDTAYDKAMTADDFSAWLAKV